MAKKRKPPKAPKRYAPPRKPWRKMKCPKCGKVIWRKPYVSDAAKCHDCGFQGNLVLA